MEYRPKPSRTLAIAALVVAGLLTAAVAFLPDAIAAVARVTFDPWWAGLDPSARLHWTWAFKSFSGIAPVLPVLLFGVFRARRKGRDAGEEGSPGDD
jgi:hypothetical protein